MTTSTTARVIQLVVETKNAGQPRPTHWVDDKGSAFLNPWPSWRDHSFTEFPNLAWTMSTQSPKIPKDIDKILPVRSPIWGRAEDRHKIQATWLGHACFFLELPVSGDAPRGIRVLFDPVSSDRCSPSQFMGPKRYTEIPCPIESIPEVDAVVISHNHYDHLDTHTIRTLLKRVPQPHFFAPLGNEAYFASLNAPSDHVHILDWWQTRRLEVDFSSSSSATPTTSAADITCTPAQHMTGRGLSDRFKSLWSSWAIRSVSDRSLPANEGTGVKAWFGGDTGYRAVHPGKQLEELECCPVFKEIGERFWGFDFAMIPIGAYLPRHFMSPMHCDPGDSVCVFKDVRAKKALGMHWGAWILTTEDIMDPPKDLAKECKKVGIEEDQFGVCEIGETVAI